MNCPHCGKPIGGSVEMGSQGYARVSKGCCPHCGRAMPSGYKVGFAKDFRPPEPEKYNLDEVQATASMNTYKLINVIVSGLLGGTVLFLAGAGKLGIPLAIVTILCGLYYYLLRGMAMMPVIKISGQSGPDKTTTSPFTNKVLILANVASVTAGVLAYFAARPPLKTTLIFAGIYALHLLLEVPSFGATAKRAISEARNESRNASLLYTLAGIVDPIDYGDVKCALCGKPVGENFTSLNMDKGFVLLCDKCVPWVKDLNETEIQGHKAVNLSVSMLRGFAKKYRK